jgi:cyclic di-GMP phosphodiesterase
MKPHRILVVDDLEQNRALLAGIAQSLGFEVETAGDGLEALGKLPLGIDLVLLDVMMPGIDGFEVVRRIRDHPGYRDLPVIMVTALDSREDRMRSVEAGANDYIAKPVDKVELKVRVGLQLRLKDAQDQLKRYSAELEATVAERTRALREALNEMVDAQRKTEMAHLDCIHRLVLASGFRDGNITGHIHRMSVYSAAIARSLSLSPREVEILKHASPLHDVGKIGICDAILLKQGSLTAEEREAMKAHATIGGEILAGSPSEIIQAGEVIALTHHEWWNGTGYPRGLAGADIPLSGRICAVADCFDALTSDRPYRLALSPAEALDLMRREEGHFDPDVFRILEKMTGRLADLQSELHPSKV